MSRKVFSWLRQLSYSLVFVNMLFLLFMTATPVLAEECEQHDFGSESTQSFMYANGITFDFTAENDMAVGLIESNLRLSGWYTINVSVSINNSQVALWSHNPTASYTYYTNTERVGFDLLPGDTITLKLWGGTSTQAAGSLLGPNYLRLCSLDPVAISPEVLNLVPGGILNSFDSPDPLPGGFTYDGTDLWLAGSSTDIIIHLDLSGNVLGSFNSPDPFPSGLAFDGTDLWFAGDGSNKIYKLDTSGTVLDYFDSPDISLRDLAFDGTNLWLAGSETTKIYKLDTSGNVLGSFNSPDSQPCGLTFDGTYLWLSGAENNRIYKLDTSGNVLGFFDSPDSLPMGLAFDGTDLWLSGDYNDMIYELLTDVTVGYTGQETFTVTNNTFGAVDIGTLSITGTNHSEFDITNDNCSDSRMTADETCTCDVVFTAASPGAKSATLQVPTSNPDRPLIEVPLTAEVSGGTPCDFNADGKSDLLFRNPVNGKVGAWLMDGTTEDTWAFIGNYGTAWDARGVGDFNGDQKVDIVFRNNNGMVGIWLMNGTTEDTWQPMGNHGTFWNVKGVGDFNQDGQVDVVYRNNSGMVGIWLMNGATEDTWQPLVNHGAAWDVKGVGDFNDDGSVDILYSSTSGMVGVWLMNGTTEDTWVPIANHGTYWQPECVADYNGDGKVDVVYQNTNGMVGIWLMDGITEDTWVKIANHGDWEVR